jgi:hypothetical protein
VDRRLDGGNVAAKANPCCGYVTDTGLNPFEPGLVPGPGDIDLCMNCGEIMVYTSWANDKRLARAGEVQAVWGKEFELLMRMRKRILKRGRLH